MQGRPQRDSVETLDTRDNKPINIHGEELIKKFISASQWETEIELTRTEICRKLIDAGDKPFTVGFLKDDGSFRHLTGHLIQHEDLMGRTMVFDFDSPSGDPIRQVNHRTISYLILDGVLYRVKGWKPQPNEEPRG